MLSDDILYVALLYCIQFLYYYSTVHKINNIVTKQQEDVTSHYSTPNISGRNYEAKFNNARFF